MLLAVLLIFALLAWKWQAGGSGFPGSTELSPGRAGGAGTPPAPAVAPVILNVPTPRPLEPPRARSASLAGTKVPGQKPLFGTARGAGHGSAWPRSSQRGAEPKGSSEARPRNPGHRWRTGSATEAVMCAGLRLSVGEGILA